LPSSSRLRQWLMDPEFDPYLQELRTRSLPEGGFAGRRGKGYRADATAWAVLALAAADTHREIRKAARQRLARAQLPDGRVSVTPDNPHAVWTTPLAILAWHGARGFEEAQRRAVTFLVGSSGLHWARQPDSPSQHDTALRGWSWTTATHSWVEPTGLALIALRAAGQEDHPRAVEASEMLLDRMLSGGGWNYGNTVVFGQELRPSPESTGVALAALAGRVAAARLKASLAYLESLLPTLRAPLSLGWSVLALQAWGRRPASASSWLFESLERQARWGAYDTAHLALLLVAYLRTDLFGAPVPLP
jgi:hypothetical protein